MVFKAVSYRLWAHKSSAGFYQNQQLELKLCNIQKELKQNPQPSCTGEKGCLWSGCPQLGSLANPLRKSLSLDDFLGVLNDTKNSLPFPSCCSDKVTLANTMLKYKIITNQSHKEKLFIYIKHLTVLLGILTFATPLQASHTTT